jgi:parvulin-like peptidyl-prolyl isomerase
VRKAELELAVAGYSRNKPTEPRQELEALVDRTLLAEEARRMDLDEDPIVRARLAACEREVLAKALLDKRLAASADEAALRGRYEKEKDALARRQLHVRHIVVRVGRPDDPEALRAGKSRINSIYARLVGGEDFAEVAGDSSEDAATAKKGGDLGPVLQGQVHPEFFTHAEKLKKGERTEPFATPFGLHIAEALEDPRMVTPPFEELRGKFAAEARREAEAKLLEELRSEIGVELRLENLEGSTR